MSRPAATVVIPTYQRRESVRRAVRSALAQSVADVEVIVVDDGSTDGTHEALAGLDERVTCVRQDNRGAAAARNAGIGRAAAPVVAFLDSDNRWGPTHLEALLGMLERHPGAVLASTCPGFMEEPSSGGERLVDPLPDVLLGVGVGYLSCVAARTADLLAVGGFHEEMVVGEDTDLWCQLALRGPFCVAAMGTLERGAGPDSLKQRGRDEGLYPAAWRLSAERFRASLGDSADGRLADAARAMELWAGACQALVAGDAAAARPLVEEALRLFPEMSQHPAPIVRRLPWAHPRWNDDSARERTLGVLAEVWPAGAAALRSYST